MKRSKPLAVIAHRSHNQDRWQWSVDGRQHLDLTLIAQDTGGVLYYFNVPANTIPETKKTVSIDSHPSRTTGWLKDYFTGSQSPLFLRDEVPAGQDLGYANN